MVEMEDSSREAEERLSVKKEFFLRPRKFVALEPRVCEYQLFWIPQYGEATSLANSTRLFTV